MGNVTQYLKWRGDLSFKAAPFCEIDNIILAMLSFIDYSSAVSDSVYAMPVRLDKCFDENRIKYPNGERFGQIIPDTTNDLFIAAARSPRFREVYVAAYRAKIEEEECLQFAAVTSRTVTERPFSVRLSAITR